GGEGGQHRALGGGEEAIEAGLGLVAAARAVDGAEGLRERPGRADDRSAANSAHRRRRSRSESRSPAVARRRRTRKSSGAQVARCPERRAPLGRRRPTWRWRSRRTVSSAVLAPRTRWKRSATIRAPGSSARMAWR